VFGVLAAFLGNDACRFVVEVEAAKDDWNEPG
jgi:hypothetical protein